MSRVGSSEILIPDGTTCTYVGNVFVAKGKLGEQKYEVPSEVKVIIEGNAVKLSIANTSDKLLKSTWGTTRANLANLISGVTHGFEKKIEIHGVGYRAAMQGKILNMQLGYSHDVNFEIPEEINVVVEKTTPAVIIVSGANKQRVGQISAEIRSYRPPEPYKGKGLRYNNEYILRKEGKKK